jgi:hypothetical protein
VNAADFFHDIVEGNYRELFQNRESRRLLWNATVSMNTVPEYVALDRLGYKDVSRQDLDLESKRVRDSNPILDDLKYCAETFKHVRKIKDHRGTFTTIATSTGVSDADLTTWKIDKYYLLHVLQNAIATLRALPELKK